MAEIQNTLADLVKFSSEQKPIEFGDAFNSLIASRIETAIDAKKIEVAKGMFNPSPEADEDIDTENTEQEPEEE